MEICVIQVVSTLDCCCCVEKEGDSPLVKELCKDFKLFLFFSTNKKQPSGSYIWSEETGYTASVCVLGLFSAGEHYAKLLKYSGLIFILFLLERLLYEF